jgi:heme/copper-type cytochrome/quinol oxidase subunit 2
MLKNKMLAVIVIVVAAALGGGIMTFAIGLPSSPCAGITGTTRYFTIVASSNGFNDSLHHQQWSWPVMTVHRCDIVKITIINSDTQTHGFAVDYYATRGTDVPGQQTYTAPVSFQASKIGQFRVYCISFCTIHTFMQNGLLTVV